MIDRAESAPAINVDRDGLRTFYDNCFLAMFHSDVRPGTIIELRCTLSIWENITGNPPLAAITNQTLADFRARLMERPGVLAAKLSTASVNKHLRHVHGLLGKLGPSGPGCRDSLELLPRVPYARYLREQRRSPQAPSLDTIGRIYSAAPAAAFPKLPGLAAATWWQGLVVTAYNLGSRHHALLSLRDEDIDWERRLVHLSADHDKCHSDRCKPLAKIAAAHLQPLRGRGVLFAWPHGSRTFYRTWHSIQDAAGLGTGDHIRIHDLKRACASNLSRLVSPWAVKHQLDHSQRDVTGGHYVDPLEELIERIDQLPQPKQFRLPGEVMDEPATTEPLYVDAFAFGSSDDGPVCAMADPWNLDDEE